MLTTHHSTLALAALVGSLAASHGSTAAPPAPANTLSVSGTSNLHDWSCTSTTFSTAVEFEAAEVPGNALPRPLKSLSVRVPVRSLKCDHSGMDDNTFKALKVDQDPDITFTMGDFTVTPTDSKGAFAVHAKGTLTVAGEAQTVTMDVSGQRLPDGSVTAAATIPLKMTDYGISPPTALLGTIKAGDGVKVTFALTVVPARISGGT